MKTLYTILFWLSASIFIGLLLFWVMIRFWHETLTETQLFLKFWYIMPVTLVFGIATIFLIHKRNDA